MKPADIRDAKIALAFQALNVSGSGRMSSADLEAYSKETAQRLRCDADRERELSESMQALWRYLEDNSKGPVGVAEFTNAIRTGLDAGNEFYDRVVTRIVDALVHAADRNGDGIISKEDYLAFYAATTTDEAAVMEGYRKLDLNADGAVTVDEFRKVVRQFYSFEGLDAAGSFLLGKPVI
ncbi:EF-hand domain-containing protein [Nonomuraea sp. NPDC050404]|uniref:EF-hand domain-containing protein n=1 Tax=Nonomuraea sp. NPDC050404 TaxID=3155783 RepID=UPI0033E79413